MKLFHITGKLSSCIVNVNDQQQADGTARDERRMLVKGGMVDTMIEAFDEKTAAVKIQRRYHGIILRLPERDKQGQYKPLAVCIHQPRTRRRWDEEKGKFTTMPTYNPRKTTLNRLNTLTTATSKENLDRFKAHFQGRLDAKRLFSNRKKAENSLKASKAYKDSDLRTSYETGFRAGWKPTTKTKKTKKTRKTAVPA